MFGHDPQHSGRSPSVVPQGPNVKWIFQDNSIPFWEPVVSADGTIYVGGGFLSTTGGLYALKPDGSLKWKNGAIRVFSSPVLGDQGEIYVLDRLGLGPSLVALNPDGTEKWRYQRFFVHYGIELVSDSKGNVYYVTDCMIQNGPIHLSLLAFNSQGSIIWLYDVVDRKTYPNGICGVPAGAGSGEGPGPVSTPALDTSGNLYFLYKQSVFSIASDGTQRWVKDLGHECLSACFTSIAPDGTLYAAGRTQIQSIDLVYVFALTQEGSIKWSFTLSAGNIDTQLSWWAQPAVGDDGTLYLPLRTYFSFTRIDLVAIGPSGNVKWQILLSFNNTTIPVIGGDGTIYILSESVLRAYDSNGNQKWSSVGCSGPITAGQAGLVIGSPGILYAAGPQKLCAFGE